LIYLANPKESRNPFWVDSLLIAAMKTGIYRRAIGSKQPMSQSVGIVAAHRCRWRG